MHADLVTVPATMPFLEVQHLFVVANISGAPMVDATGRVLGMVTSSDLLRALDQVCDDDADLGLDEDDAPVREHLGDLVARDVGTPEVVWVPLDTPISRVAQLMHSEGIHRVLVGENGRVAGILTAFDLLRAVT